MTIKHDSGSFILVYCTTCVHWNTSTFTRMEAHLKGALHEALVHPGAGQARDSAWTYAKQHAEEFAPYRGSSVYAVIIGAWEFSEGGRSQRTSLGS